MLRRIAVGLLIFAFNASGFADDRFIASPARVTDDELNAIAALSAQTKSIYFMKQDVERVIEEFALLKQRFPNLAKIRDIMADARTFSEVVIVTNASMKAQLEPLVARAIQLTEPVNRFQTDSVELPEYQSQVDIAALAARVPIQTIKANYVVGRNTPLKVNYVILELATVVNVPFLIQTTGKEPGAISSNPPIGDGTRVLRCALSTTKSVYLVSFGIGDCPAGCIERANYKFDLNLQTKTVVNTETTYGKPALPCE